MFNKNVLLAGIFSFTSGVGLAADYDSTTLSFNVQAQIQSEQFRVTPTNWNVSDVITMHPALTGSSHALQTVSKSISYISNVGAITAKLSATPSLTINGLAYLQAQANGQKTAIPLNVQITDGTNQPRVLNTITPVEIANSSQAGSGGTATIILVDSEPNEADKRMAATYSGQVSILFETNGV